MRVPFVERFWAKVEIPLCADGSPDPDRCWMWMGGISRSFNGDIYGTIRGEVQADGSQPLVRAARASLQLTGRDLEPGEEACHMCPDWGEPLCVNPGHLVPGSHKNNLYDVIQRWGGLGIPRPRTECAA